MAKLSDEIIRQGEQLIRSENLIELDRFVHKNIKWIEHARLMEAIQTFIDSGQIGHAVSVWKQATKEHDDSKMFVSGVVRAAIRAFWYVGALGGIVYWIDRFFR